MTVTVKQRKVSELREHPRNPRYITEARLAQLGKSIAADPDMLAARPIIALPDGTVIAGNMRLRAVQELGWPTVPTVTVDLDEERATVWALRDNNHYGQWDDDLLATFIDELRKTGADLDLAGFDAADLALTDAPPQAAAFDLPRVQVGRYSFRLTDDEYDAWEADMTARFDDVNAEILRLLEIEP